jgi:hypothetical protein
MDSPAENILPHFIVILHIMIAQLFFQVKHLLQKKQDLETTCVKQIGIYRADARNAKCRMQNAKL